MVDNTDLLIEMNENLKIIKKTLYWILGVLILGLSALSPLDFSEFAPYILIIVLIIGVPYLIFKLPVKNRYERAEEALKKKSQALK